MKLVYTAWGIKSGKHELKVELARCKIEVTAFNYLKAKSERDNIHTKLVNIIKEPVVTGMGAGFPLFYPPTSTCIS